MELLNQEIRSKLLHNDRVQRDRQLDGLKNADFIPVVKLFTPDAGCLWLLTEIDPEFPDLAYGLCDLGMGFPELGSVAISELQSIRGRFGLPVERDLYFAPTKKLSAYVEEACQRGRIDA